MSDISNRNDHIDRLISKIIELKFWYMGLFITVMKSYNTFCSFQNLISMKMSYDKYVMILPDNLENVITTLSKKFNGSYQLCEGISNFGVSKLLPRFIFCCSELWVVLLIPFLPLFYSLRSQSCNRRYIELLEQLHSHQQICFNEIKHQRYRMNQISASLRQWVLQVINPEFLDPLGRGYTLK